MYIQKWYLLRVSTGIDKIISGNSYFYFHPPRKAPVSNSAGAFLIQYVQKMHIFDFDISIW